MQSIDGNQAAAHVAYALSDVAFIFPITPSTPMGEHADAWSSQGRKNIFGQVVEVTEMQSEAGAAGAVHGAAAAGSLVTTYTASQGLLLMIPNMYKIAGELMPVVFHVTARSIAGQALCIFGDHSDVMAARSTGFNMLSSHSVQEASDMALITHIAALNSSLPFMHFFDGFRTSHEIQKVEVLKYDQIKEMIPMDKVQAHREHGLNPKQPHLRGTSQGPDVYFQNVEAANKYYDAVPQIVEEAMKQFETKFGRSYHLFDYYGAADADRIVIIMGAGAPVCEEAADFLNSKGEKVGIVKVHLFRPWSAKHLLAVIPKTVKTITVLERTKEPGSLGEPMYLDVCSSLKEFSEMASPKVIGGRYGLGSKDFTPAMAKAVFDNMKDGKQKNHFTVGITDDVTFHSLQLGEEFNAVPEGTTQCMFWGLGSDGTVGANHDAIRIIGDNTQLFVQGYFSYDAHKSGGVTVSHLRFGQKPIKSQYLIQYADYIACHFPNYVYKYKLVENLKQNGTFVLNCGWTKEQVEKELPGSLKRALAKHQAKFYIINAATIAESVGLGRRINMVMQAVFFKLANVLPYEQAKELLKKAIAKTYGSKGQAIVDMNVKAVDQSIENLVAVEIPASWANAPLEEEAKKDAPQFVRELLWPQLAMQGNSIPVSKFTPGGIMPMGTTKFEKRGIAPTIPIWDSSKCMQCNECSLVCPHAAIRSFLLDQKETAAAPKEFITIPFKGEGEAAKLNFRVQVSAMDCTGCEVCSTACNFGALAMKPFATESKRETINWDFSEKITNKGHLFDRKTLIGSQFQPPLMEFSGACEGCNETAYMKLVTQLFGERMVVAQATGCSSIWGGTWGTIPYTTNAKGHGPAWGNSLFEDNAEYGLGMAKANAAARNRLRDAVKAAIPTAEGELKALLEKWEANFTNAAVCEEVFDKIVPILEKEKAKYVELHGLRHYFPKLSQWIFGGDGWAYDIGYGGLDHVVASGVDLNIVVLDTEMYSNTGGQKSKATPLGAVAKFAAAGNRANKKDLGMIAMSYKNVYVASVALQADYNQAISAFTEAEAYNGVSLILCYSPCREQGFNISMSLEESRLAVQSGYWNLYRYNPALIAQGKNPFTLDSKTASYDLKQFLTRENRYSLLMRTQKDVATGLQQQLGENYKARLAALNRLADGETKAAAPATANAAASTGAAASARAPGDMNKRVAVSMLPAGPRSKNFEEACLGYNKEEATEESKRCLGCKKPGCAEQCPAHLPIPQYIAAIKAGEYTKAAELVTDVYPFLHVCGRVCPHTCEAKCVRGKKGEPLAIELLKRFAADNGTPAKASVAPASGKKVAVIGSGPAGLQAAYLLARAGHKVTIFEQKSVAGGMMALCIPPYRLPRKMLQADIDRVLALGVELKLNTKISNIDELMKEQGFAAVFMGCGTMMPKCLNIPGDDAQGVEHVLPFLESVNINGRKTVGKKVAVIGAGFSAMDAVRTAKRLGADAMIIYRRDRDQMPATKEEVHEAEEEGCVLHTLVDPVEILTKDGKVCGIKCIRQKLGAPDASGRAAPEPIPNSEFTIECDMVIPAISQRPELDSFADIKQCCKYNTVTVDEKFMTTRAGVFAAGDNVTGPKTIIEAVADATKAVQGMIEFLKQ
eukprot:TRINITY_DN13_c0_g1_i5.p1 TRINITY_DN13_c0_g1~~TRINITY_DN13_c0_g1_i5.p1  ORF type:complete len:1625 (+),score=488.79 TRINITY_DN13_c0_g1_i5:200-5074(+)